MKAALAALALLAATPAIAQPIEGEGPGRQTTLDVSAAGEARAAPDMASVVLGVTSQAPTAAEAAQVNARQMTQVLAAVRRLGVPDKDIQTAGLTLNPDYAYVDNQPPRLSGYKASNTVTVTVNDLAKLGPVLDGVAAAGANQIDGVTFGLKNPQAAEDQARVLAVKALQRKAELYAQATGYHVGRLVTLREGNGPGGGPTPVFAMAMAKAAAPTPVQPGELTVRIDVTAVYDLAR